MSCCMTVGTWTEASWINIHLPSGQFPYRGFLVASLLQQIQLPVYLALIC